MTDIAKMGVTLVDALKDIQSALYHIDNGRLSKEEKDTMNKLTLPELIGEFFQKEKWLSESLKENGLWEEGGEWEQELENRKNSHHVVEVMGLFLLICLPWFKTHGGFKEGPQWFPREAPAAKYNRELLKYLREKLK